MEKGEMRVEANISVSKTEKFGTKVEVKNLNSFRAVERAILYEVNRHVTLLESGQSIVQETRGWDENKQSTFSQRAKEDSHDYRYFPDPDLPKLYISEVAEFSHDAIKKELPELPWEKRERFIKNLKLKPEDAEMYVGNMHLAELFEKTVSAFSKDEKKIQLASNYITSDLSGMLKNEKNMEEALSKFSSDAFAKLITMTAEGKIGSRGAKDILAVLYKVGGDPEKIANEKGLIQKSDPEALKKMVAEIVTENPAVVADFKAGKAVALQFLVGQGMKKSKGSANPAILKQLFEEGLK
jgi:aspartyl-tRNA(Asn)/glutamyl-tRNA(Gln) amidotransferase subunit B